MSDAARAMERAGNRLDAALEALEAALEERQASEQRAGALDAELQALSQDRSRLAHELDHARSRGQRLDSAAAEVEGRLDAAIAALGDVIARDADS